MSKKDISGTKRRAVLKTMGAGTVGLGGFASVVSADNPTLEGVVYDTLTQKTGGTITGNVERKNGELRGAVNVAGYSLPLESLTRVDQTSEPRYNAILEDKKYREDSQPLKVEFVEHTGPNPHFSGTLTRPSDKFGRLGFTLVPDPEYDAQKAAEAKTPDSRWVNSEHSFLIPETGIPTDTGSRRLVQILDGTPTGENGGDQR